MAYNGPNPLPPHAGGTGSPNVDANTLTLSRPFNVSGVPSFATTLSLGTAFQNVGQKDIVLTVYLNITVNTTGTLSAGVGSTNTPTTQTLLSGLTALGFFPVTLYVPANYYALITVSNITASITGQQATAV